MACEGLSFSLAHEVLHAACGSHTGSADCDQGHGVACLSMSSWCFYNPACPRKGQRPGPGTRPAVEAVGWKWAGGTRQPLTHLFPFRGAGAGTAGRAEVRAGQAEPRRGPVLGPILREHPDQSFIPRERRTGKQLSPSWPTKHLAFPVGALMEPKEEG